MRTTINKLEDLGRLPDGWRFGFGRSPSIEVQARAREILTQGIALQLVSDVFPEEGGGIAVEFYSDDLSLGVLVNADLSLDMWLERGRGAEFDSIFSDEGVSASRVRHEMLKLAGPTWNLPDYYTEESTQYKRNGGRTIVLKTQPEVEAYRWLTSNVYAGQGTTYAITSSSITPHRSRATRSSSGRLRSIG